MAETNKPIRVLFCGAVLQNFFDLKQEDIMPMLQGAGMMMKTIRETPGITVLSTMDDDQTMVGTSPDGYPWTFYIMADAVDRDAVVEACNVLRTVKVGEHLLWRYIRIEARLGRELDMPEPE